MTKKKKIIASALGLSSAIVLMIVTRHFLGPSTATIVILALLVIGTILQDLIRSRRK